MNDAPKVGVKQKKPYAKPEVKQVLLKPEEAVLGNCKGIGAGPSNSSCKPLTQCYLLGS
jgi:hypothetical protein